MKSNRRDFIRNAGMAAGLGLFSGLTSIRSFASTDKKLFFRISLAEWSLHRTLQSGAMTNLDFPSKAKNDFGISAVEYVDQYFRDKARDQVYLKELKKRSEDVNVRNVLIMIDTAGALANTGEAERKQAIENHYQWIDAAKFLGCHSIRVNLRGTGSAEDLAHASVDSLGKLSEYGEKIGIGVIVENHGGVTSNGKWLVN